MKPSIYAAVFFALTLVSTGCNPLGGSSSTSTQTSGFNSRVSPTGVVELGSTVTPASAADILSGLEAWDGSGAKITGTMANQGTFNESLAFPGAGFYSGTVTNAPTAGQIVVGNTILGIAGTAGNSMGYFSSSQACRAVGTTQLTLLQEVTTYAGSSATPDLPTTAGYTYRDIPLINMDDDGYWNADASTCLGTTPINTCTPSLSITLATHTAYVNCGEPTTMAADNIAGKNNPALLTQRIAHCADVGRNGANATWLGQTNGIRGEANWSLATRLGFKQEVWQDQRTGLLWSSLVAPSAIGDNWCRASGNAESTDVSNVCNSTTYQPQFSVVPVASRAESECAEGLDPNGNALVSVPGWCSDGNAYASVLGCPAVWTPNTENWGAGTYATAKGGMGANSPTLHVRWRLPTLTDYMQASVDGIRSVMPDMGTIGGGLFDWSSTVTSGNRNYAWFFHDSAGDTNVNLRTGSLSVRCVGR